MKIVFVNIDNENLATQFLSSFLKKNNHQVDMVFDPNLFNNGAIKSEKLAKIFDTKIEITKEVLSKKPDLIGFSVFTDNYQRTLILAKEIKKLSPHIPIIFGGIHPTSVPDVVIKEKCVDYICVGEGEYALLELLNNLHNSQKISKIKNIWSKNKNKIIKNSVRHLLENLDQLPLPDKSIFYDTQPKSIKNNFYAAISSRGCPFNCTYCSNNIIQRVYKGLGKPYRQRNFKNLIKELVIAKKKYHPREISFMDDVFVANENWLKKFIHLYQKKINIPFYCLTHPQFLTLKTAKLLKKAKCYLVGFGIQTYSEKTRTKILHRFETNKQIRIAVKNCQKVGLKFTIDHIFCLPGEKLEDQIESLKFYNELRPHRINSNYLQYFPRADIIKTAVKMKLFPQNIINKIEKGLTNTSYFVVSNAKDSFNSQLIYNNIRLIFVLLPYLPKSIVDKIITKKLYLIPFTIPSIIIAITMATITLLNGRLFVYSGLFKYFTYFSIKNIQIKLKYRFKTTITT